MAKKQDFTIIQSLIFVTIFSIAIVLLLNISLLDRNTKIKNSINKLNNYNVATVMFKKKYGSLPGDIRKTQIFKLSKVNTDGNENGFIDTLSKDGENIISKGEVINFWLHLSNSKLIDKYYNGGDEKYAKKGKTLPIIDINNVGFSVFNKKNNHYFVIGISEIENDIIKSSDNSLLPIEAFLIDKKFDNGIPNSGKFKASGGSILNGTKNVNELCATKREYLTKNKNRYCQLRWNLNF